VQTTIIDFGLSRLALPSGEVALTPLPEDVYDGVGEQWDVYRQMKSLVGEDWQDFHGETNVMVHTLHKTDT
jgi:serine/threonine-protein kinase haspin